MSDDATDVPGAPAEATGKDLRADLTAWTLLASLSRKEHVVLAKPMDPGTDRMSAAVLRRTTFDDTFSAQFRVKGDQDIPAKVLEAIAHEHMPQFTLRNIGRAEHHVDLEEPLPFVRMRGIGHDDDGLFDEVRNARTPKPEMAQVWSVDFNTRMRGQLRRLLLEDPWELRYGAEVKANFGGPLHRFVVEGTHADDLPDADWGPRTMPPPDDWQGRGIDDDENVDTFHDLREKILGAGD